MQSHGITGSVWSFFEVTNRSEDLRCILMNLVIPTSNRTKQSSRPPVLAQSIVRPSLNPSVDIAIRGPAPPAHRALHNVGDARYCR